MHNPNYKQRAQRSPAFPVDFVVVDWGAYLLLIVTLTEQKDERLPLLYERIYADHLPFLRIAFPESCCPLDGSIVIFFRTAN